MCWGEAQEFSSIHPYTVRVCEGLLDIGEPGGTETQAPAISGRGALKQGGLSTRRIMWGPGLFDRAQQPMGGVLQPLL